MAEIILKRIKDHDQAAVAADVAGSTTQIPIDDAGYSEGKIISALELNKGLADVSENDETAGVLATLDGVGKLKLSQRPSGAQSYVGDWDPETNTPTLTDAGGSNGEVYRINIASGAASYSRDLGAGSKTWHQGGTAEHDGTEFDSVKDAANIFNGSSTEDQAATAGDYYRTGDVNDRTNARQPANAIALSDGAASGILTCPDSDLTSFGDGAGNDSAFTVLMRVKLTAQGSQQTLFRKYGTSGNREYIASITSSNKLKAFLVDGSNIEINREFNLPSGYLDRWIDLAVVVNPVSSLASRADDIAAYVDGVALTENSKANSGSYAGMSNTSTPFSFGSGVASQSNFEQSHGLLISRALTAQQLIDWTTDGNIPIADQWGGSEMTSGPLEVGQRYRITDFQSGDDFTNVGAGSNANDVEFIATGTTPTTWSNSSGVTPVGAVVALLPENIMPTGNVNDPANGLHAIGSNVTLLRHPTSGQFAEEIELAHGSISSSAATTTLLTLPKGCRIVGVETIVDAAFDASTTLNVGITGTATKYVNALNVASTGRNYNSSTHASESDTAGTAVYVQKNQATTQGNAKFRIIYEITNPSA